MKRVDWRFEFHATINFDDNSQNKFTEENLLSPDVEMIKRGRRVIKREIAGPVSREKSETRERSKNRLQGNRAGIRRTYAKLVA